MNVADYSLVLSPQRVAAGARRDAKIESESRFSLQKLHDAQKIAPGRRVGVEPERRPAAERRTQRRPAPETAPRPTRRDDDERGRLLDVYC